MTPSCAPIRPPEQSVVSHHHTRQQHCLARQMCRYGCRSYGSFHRSQFKAAVHLSDLAHVSAQPGCSQLAAPVPGPAAQCVPPMLRTHADGTITTPLPVQQQQQSSLGVEQPPPPPQPPAGFSHLSLRGCRARQGLAAAAALQPAATPAALAAGGTAAGMGRRSAALHRVCGRRATRHAARHDCGRLQSGRGNGGGCCCCCCCCCCWQSMSSIACCSPGAHQQQESPWPHPLPVILPGVNISLPTPAA